MLPAIKIDVWLTVAITQAHPDLIAGGLWGKLRKVWVMHSLESNNINHLLLLGYFHSIVLLMYVFQKEKDTFLVVDSNF